MDTQASITESVVRSHLQTFLEERGVPAIVADYDEDACVLSEDGTYRGKREIGAFFDGFIASLPPQGIRRFALRSLRVEGDVAFITWNVGNEWPLGTDSFVVRSGKIVLQTFAMHAARAS